MFRILTNFRTFEGKTREIALDEYVSFHIKKDKPLAAIKSASKGGDFLDKFEIEDLQEEAQELWNNSFEEDDSDYYGNIEAGNEALFLKGGRF